MLKEKLAERKLPDILAGTDVTEWEKRRAEIVQIYADEVYGRTPEFNTELYSFVEKKEDAVLTGQASRERIRLSFMTPNGMFSFPFTLVLPKKGQPVPAFVQISFDGHMASVEHFPQEMLLDEGFAIAILHYSDVTSDTEECDGLARAYEFSMNSQPGGEEGTHWGKIGMWAFAASRIMDYLETRPEIDASRVAVSGHSRLGKTALWCAVQDERFSMAVSNNSGCTGAAVHRGKVGENVYDITTRFPYWFCKNYQNYNDKEEELPIDQHMLLACMAPRTVYVNSAKEDEWADPQSEYLGAAAASEIWEKLGLKGLVSSEELPEEPELNKALPEGNIAYRLREGIHFMGRSDWEAYIEFRKIHNV